MLQRTSSPVHVHVPDETPVHLHLNNRPKKIRFPDELEERIDRERMSSSLKSPTRRRSRSASARAKVPWVPAPGKSTRDDRLTWQGNMGTLDIAMGGGRGSHGVMRYSELVDEDAEGMVESKRAYEKRIGSLMGDVGALKNELDLQKTLHEMEKRNDELDLSRRVLTSQELELNDTKDELMDREKENRKLRDTVETLRDGSPIGLRQSGGEASERDRLMQKLVETELDGQAVSQQLSQLRDTLKHMAKERKPHADSLRSLTVHKDHLTKKLDALTRSSRTLRTLLQAAHEREGERGRLSQQRDLLADRLHVADDQNERLRAQLLESEKKLLDSRIQSGSQKDETLRLTSLQTSLEQTRGHLQKELRSREGDCNRMAVQVRALESELAQEKIETDHLQELLRQAHGKHEKDKEALKKATRVQKHRASKSEDAADMLNARLLEKEQNMAELQVDCNTHKLTVERAAKEKEALLTDLAAYRSEFSGLEKKQLASEDAYRSKLDVMATDLQEKTKAIIGLRAENDKFKELEGHYTQAVGQLSSQKTELQHLDSLVSEYRAQVVAQQRESDHLDSRLREQQRAHSQLKVDSHSELARVKQALESRLVELEPLPALLKSTELKYHESGEKAYHYERKCAENAQTIADLTAQVERLSHDSDSMKDKHTIAETRLQARIDTQDSNLSEIEKHNSEMISSLAKKDESLNSASLKMEELLRTNSSLTQQLQQALSSTHRVCEETKEKYTMKEKSMQSRARDLDEALTQTRAELCRAKREKDEVERKFNSKLYDLKDRLEQSHSTNRSMQNYVQFLKSSYANVFGDVSVGMAATGSPSRSPTRSSPPYRPTNSGSRL